MSMIERILFCVDGWKLSRSHLSTQSDLMVVREAVCAG